MRDHLASEGRCEVDTEDREFLYDTIGEMTPEENNAATKELFDATTDKMIANNKPRT